jgi:SAM-dependent methyltransferase
MPATSPVQFGLSSEAWASFEQRLRGVVADHGLKRILEVGGGANPMLPIEDVRAQGLEYTVLDISETELSKAPEGYRTVCADIAQAGLQIEGGYDFAFSRMLAEHVPSGEMLHRNIHALLRPGGYAMHFFPTLWAPPFLINRLLPERATDRLLAAINPRRDRYRLAKFPAHYSWCRGPTPAQLQRFDRLGYDVVSYGGYFGHGRYYQHFPRIQKLHLRVAGYLARHPRSWATSFAVVVLRKR